MAPQPHALLVPCSAQGHINGLLRLAQALSSEGFAISFVYFARFYSQRKSLIKNDPAIRIEVVPDGLPQDAEDTPVLEDVATMQAGLEQLVEKLNQQARISCIISDTFMPWTQGVADKFGIPRIDYWTSTATSYSMFFHIPQIISKGYLPLKGPISSWKREEATMIDFIPGLPPFPITELPKELLVEDLSDPFFQFLRRAFSRVREAERILIHSVYELERSAFDALRADQIPVYSVGPLIDSAPCVENGTPAEADIAAPRPGDEECLKWLDLHAVASVIYVSFGSVGSLSPQETQEMAFGLEASKQPFIWVIRSNSIKSDSSQIFPEGFLSRTKERGVIMSWAPQLAVLAHPSVGGFLTHCGWNSTLESLWMGVPMIGCPRAAEQRSNGRFITHEWKVGLELERKPDGSFTREAVERAVKELMGGEEGREVRRRMRELREAVKKTVGDGGLSRRNLQKFAEDMFSL